MARVRYLPLVFCVVMMASVLHAQGGAGRASGHGQMTRQQSPSMQQGSMQGQSMQNPQQMRVQSQATEQQRGAMKRMTSATKQLRNELRQVTRLKGDQQIAAEQAKRWRERLRSQLQALRQEQQILIDSLTPEQGSFVLDDIEQMNESTATLTEMLDALDAALAEEEVEEETAKQAAKKADDQAKKVEREEKDILTELGLDL